MTTEQLLEIVNLVLTNNQKTAKPSVTPETRLREDLGMDSFLLAELTVRIEQMTGIDVFGDGLIDTVGELLGKLEVHV